MDIQKPTVLDAARLANELKRFRGAMITRAQLSEKTLELYLEISRPDSIIKYAVDKKYATIAQVCNIDDASRKTIQALSGYGIIDAAQPGDDRIVALELEKEDRLGRVRQARLILELIPNKGNCVLLDEKGDIKWAMRKIARYASPPPLKNATILNISRDRVGPDIEHPEQLTKIFGINARDIKNLRLENYLSLDSAISCLREYATQASIAGSAWLIYNDNLITGYSLVSPALDYGERIEECESALEMYGKYYALVLLQSSEVDRFEDLRKRLDKEMARAQGKLSSLSKELENAQGAAIYRRYGDLILANMDKIRKGNKSIRLANHDGETPEYFEIELDPSRSPSENAKEYFKKYKKTQSSLNVLARRIEGAKEEIKKLESVKTDCADNPEKLEIALDYLGLLPAKTVPGKRVAQARRLPFKRFIASNGWEILVGRTNAENDELTFKIARKDDYWFHAWQAAGSHVVLRLPDRSAVPDKNTLLETAALAAYHSKARTSSKVPVAYTQAKFVRKPKGFPPGKVTVEREKQLMVKPADPESFLPKADSET